VPSVQPIRSTVQASEVSHRFLVSLHVIAGCRTAHLSDFQVFAVAGSSPEPRPPHQIITAYRHRGTLGHGRTAPVVSNSTLLEASYPYAVRPLVPIFSWSRVFVFALSMLLYTFVYLDAVYNNGKTCTSTNVEQVIFRQHRIT
jgi:hypothetical protein